MKKTTAIIIFCFIALLSQSQTIPLEVRMDLTTRIILHKQSNLAGGRVGTLLIQVKPYDLYKTSSGQYYINYTDAKLVKRKKYLGYAFGIHEYENNTVFFNSDTTKAWIWQLDRYGTPTVQMNLPDFFAESVRVLKDSTLIYEH